jgi:GNAT superfamily N-acetyltransferase
MVNVRWPDASGKAELGMDVWNMFNEAGLEADRYRRHSPHRWFDELAVAEDAVGRVVGAVQARFNQEYFEEWYGEFSGLTGPQCYVEKIAVLPSDQGSCVGTLLMHKTAQEADRRRCAHLALRVDWTTDWRGRVKFFERCGLRSLVPGHEDDLYGADVETILHVTALRLRAYGLQASG